MSLALTITLAVVGVLLVVAVLGVILDRPQRKISVMASAEGGVDIEEVAKDSPEKIIHMAADPSLGLHHSFPRHFIEYGGQLYFRATDETHGRELWA